MSITIARSDRFPVGTSVAAYAAAGAHQNAKPSGTALETVTVAANGTLTFPGIAAGVPVALYAAVGGVDTALQTGGGGPAPKVGTLAERRRERQLEQGV